MLGEFRKFLLRGNVLELAVGIVIGAAFTAVVTSFVTDLLMPPIGLAMGGRNFNDLFVSLNGTPYPSLVAAKAAGAPTLNYGAFFTTVLNFVLVGFAVFLLVRTVNRMSPPAPPAATRECPYCTAAISVRAVRCPQCTSEVTAARS
jgi:large conductance mechanosensitive channel